MSERVERAEELREYIKSKRLSRSGLERILGVIICHIENLHPDKAKDDKSYEVIHAIAMNPMTLIDAMEYICKQNGEMDYE